MNFIVALSSCPFTSAQDGNAGFLASRNLGLDACPGTFVKSHNGVWGDKQEDTFWLDHVLNTHAASLEECAENCANESGCNGFVYGGNWRKGCQLYLKVIPEAEEIINDRNVGDHGDTVNLFYDDDLIACRYVHDDKCPADYIFSHHGEWTNVKVKTTTNKSKEECAELCTESYICRGFVYKSDGMGNGSECVTIMEEISQDESNKVHRDELTANYTACYSRKVQDPEYEHSPSQWNQCEDKKTAIYLINNMCKGPTDPCGEDFKAVKSGHGSREYISGVETSQDCAAELFNRRGFSYSAFRTKFIDGDLSKTGKCYLSTFGNFKEKDHYIACTQRD